MIFRDKTQTGERMVKKYFLLLTAYLICGTLLLAGCDSPRTEHLVLATRHEQTPTPVPAEKQQTVELPQNMEIVLRRYSILELETLQTQADLEAVTDLLLYNEHTEQLPQIALDGLEIFPNLCKLYLYGFSLENLEALTKLPALAQLSVVSCQIHNCDAISKLQALEELNLRDLGPIQLPDLGNLDKLRTLDLSSNALTEVDGLAGMNALETLNLDANEIATILPLKSCPALRKLSIARNRGDSITGLEELTHLESLDLSGNRLDDLAFLTHMHELKELDLSHCGLEALDWAGVAGNIEVLDLSGNPLGSLEGIEQMERLTALSIGDCGLSSLEPLTSLKQLIELDLSGWETVQDGGNSIHDFLPLAQMDGLKRLTVNPEEVPLLTVLAGSEVQARHTGDFLMSSWKSVDELLASAK